MEENKLAKVEMDYIAYEAHMELYADELRRKNHIIIWLIGLLAFFIAFATAALIYIHVSWLDAWMSYDYIGEASTVTIDGKDGNANYIGNNGDIINGTDQGN